MADLGDWLDAYERTARLVPGLLAVTPVLVLVLAAGLREDPVVVGLLSIVAAVGVPVAISNFVRDRGQHLQVEMWPRWGGSPTIALLRLRNQPPDPVRDARRHNLETATGLALPAVADEHNDPQATDRAYEAAIRSLITRTRERPRFELVFKENQGYGYWRNLLAMRPIGIPVALVIALLLVPLVVADIVLDGSAHLIDFVLSEVAVLLGLAFWVWVPTEDRVKRSAYSYAERLLDAAVMLP